MKHKRAKQEEVYKIIVDSRDASKDVRVSVNVINTLYRDGLIWKTDKPDEYVYDGSRSELLRTIRNLTPDN